ncbi:Gfo/Idh/MocA family protein [Desulfurococcus mucosus]|uniref:Oxidoreductase domain protein n=1 Tax=Desulfurococcus mucosus (strain ATCC 35584 / DSM 2162 / JCM 9187 / O7/1) TaxID=765177 RepID=E8R8B5_DESM0|nr:Gfo/Idh/MocA family oxidoreductase [Desulfurococcus mucosus]ADV64741.1 oxidoreductase domain protein [Desulfurococcus mucosus DSM 2162]
MVRLRVGIVGGGFAAGHHVKGWRANKAKVVAVSDIAVERARVFAESHGIPRYFSSLEEMLKDVELDVVSICTPPQTHREVAVKVAQANANMFVEKPLATSYSDAAEILNVARSKGVKVGVVSNYLYTPVSIKARRLVREGVIGPVCRVDIAVYAPREVVLARSGGWLESLPGHVFGEVLPHAIYILQDIIGKLDVVSVDFSRLSEGGWTLYDELYAVLRGERGVGRLTISYNARRFDIYVYVEGEKGSLIYNPVGKIISRLSTSWRWASNLLSLKPYLELGFDHIFNRAPRDPFAENIGDFIRLLERRDDDHLDMLLNQVRVYEEILREYR